MTTVATDTTAVKPSQFPENISGKSKRGRPKSAGLELLGAIYPHTTRRNLNDKRSMVRALGLLKQNGAESYFHNQRKVRQVILAALGRIESDKLLLAVAAEIANRRIPTGRALELIQQSRRFT